MTQQARIHHYVPQWYQRRFMEPGQHRYFYLDLNPDFARSGSTTYRRHGLLNWGPAKCFAKKDLYTFNFGRLTTDEIERHFFGLVDVKGRDAVEVFGKYNGFNGDVHKAYPNLLPYMDAQRFRTPRGLDQLKELTKSSNHSLLLILLQQYFQMHTTMWSEGVWEIVSARNSPTKFIVTDEPVTFFNRRIFPSEFQYPGGLELDLVGTRTLFPLGLESCLIITHTQFVRNPWLNPTMRRENARTYKPTIRYMLGTQFGRVLEEDEVLRINFILKRRATRYLAAAEEEWLYPERNVSTTNWTKLDDDWFLLPHLYKVSFTSEILVGYKDGSAWAADAYGRHPGDPRYQDKKLHDREWITHIKAQHEWARKRAGKSLAHIERMGREDDVGDALMGDYLKGEEGEA